jgi:hypothetical protein
MDEEKAQQQKIQEEKDKGQKAPEQKPGQSG